MNGWTRIEEGWYEHANGSIVQRWGPYNERNFPSGWYAWRKKDGDSEGKRFRTMREACDWCTKYKAAV